jgi:predicted DsbA family dithiol-disulfide isomerase
MNKNFILATNATCGPCYVLKARLEKSEISVNIKSLNDAKNVPWFRERNIKSVPVLIIEDDQGVELDRVSGSEDIFNYLKNNEA